MRAFGGFCLAGLLAFASSATPAKAAWNNVFQVTCFTNGARSESLSPCCPDPCPKPCPQPVCTTRYVQRCYYQPVTTYKRQVSYQPVTTYRRSYYYEPVTCYRYSCCYDPCTCSYRRVATPVTSYRLRSRCNAVTSYVQRCQMVPVTQYRQVNYYEPVTSCSYPQPSVTESSSPPPSVGEDKSKGKPSVGEQRLGDDSGANRIPAIPQHGEPRMPDADGSSLRLPPVKKPAPRIKLDRVVSLPGHNVEGRIEQAAHSQEQSTKLLFVSADFQGLKKDVTADHLGRFRANLESGRWLVYVRDQSGRPYYQKKIDVGDDLFRVSLVSR